MPSRSSFWVFLSAVPHLKAGVEYILFKDVEHADTFLVLTILALLGLAVYQSTASSRPPIPLPKRIPERPTLQLLFKPDSINITSSQTRSKSHGRSDQHRDTDGDSIYSTNSRRYRRIPSNSDSSTSRPRLPERRPMKQTEWDDGEDEKDDHSVEADDDDVDDHDHDDDEFLVEQTTPPSGIPILNANDLPDSFAPLLSSSTVEVVHDGVTADLIHAAHAKMNARLRPGRFEIPLDMDASRPQFILDIPSSGSRISASVEVGSEAFTVDEDLDPEVATNERSKPMVKHFSVTLDPPLPLLNVAPTLIHFPTLFEDYAMPRLKQIPIIRFIINFISSISSFLERCLWLIESKCQCHLSKVVVKPIYKGGKWRQSPAFSGHVQLFGYVPVPFISVTLPTFIIPQPHALLEHLLTKQPLASARLKREKIAEEKIAISILACVEKWSTELNFVGTAPGVGFDLTLPGGLSVALEMCLGRDLVGNTGLQGNVHKPLRQPQSKKVRKANDPASRKAQIQSSSSAHEYDANEHFPWSLELSARGTIDHDKMTLYLTKFSAYQNSENKTNEEASYISTSGSFAIWKVSPEEAAAWAQEMNPAGFRRRSFAALGQKSFSGHHPALDSADLPSVAAILLFPEETTSFHHYLRMLQYDFTLDVSEDTRLDSMTFTLGATHPMLKGGTIITGIADTMYAHGSLAAREDAILDPKERQRKRNILRHLPAIDFTCGVRNFFIPRESKSYSDDGQTLFVPELEGGRMMLNFLGGIDDRGANGVNFIEGIKMFVDFEVGTFNMKTEGGVKEFPELEIFEGAMLKTNIASTFNGSVKSHLRPQVVPSDAGNTGPNMLNPLEAYELDFSNTFLSIKFKEYSTVLEHRRIVLPSESNCIVKVVESVVDMGFEGKTLCELSWDFQGLSPILQVTPVGESPETATPERKEQVSLLIGPLRQGRVSLQVSSVGGIQVEKAKTSRDNKEGLYDWKFFNALVSPDESSAQRIMDVLHDKRTMEKCMQVAKLISQELHGIVEYALRQVWRAKEILDSEGVSDPGHAIPMYRMARLVSLFLTGDAQEVPRILPLVQRVVEGDGLDVVAVKDLLRQHLPRYEDWAPELDRAVRWIATLFGPISVSSGYVERDATPLAQLHHNAVLFEGIPTAKELYDKVQQNQQLPLDPQLSNLVASIAPYLSFPQLTYFLEIRAPTDWQYWDLRRLRYVYSIKKKVLEIAESYGGLSFLPQSFLVSVFLGEATRNSLRVAKQPSRAHTASRDVKTPQASRRLRGPLTSQSSLRNFRNRNSSQNLALKTAAAARNKLLGTNSERIHGRNDFEDIRSAHRYELGDSLLGPQDVAILLQSGLTSVMSSSTVVQLNQRMLLDLICSQPRSFAVAVLAEIGTPGGQGSPRSLTSALMALLELDQSAFKENHKIDIHSLLETWLPGLKIPRRDDYMAGGRWARQSYYEAIFAVATSILEDAEGYIALKSHVQRVRHDQESDPIIGPIISQSDDGHETKKLSEAVKLCQSRIERADEQGKAIIRQLEQVKTVFRQSVRDQSKITNTVRQFEPDQDKDHKTDSCQRAVESYQLAFESCRVLLDLDRHAFHLTWFKDFYKRNYDALMIKSMFDNVVDDVDDVRRWLQAMRNAAIKTQTLWLAIERINSEDSTDRSKVGATDDAATKDDQGDGFFLDPTGHSEQELVDAIIDATIFEESDRSRLKADPLVRLLLSNQPGEYNFCIISAMGVITEGKKGVELKSAFDRLEKDRGVVTIRSDTGTGRSFEYNASKIVEAVEVAVDRGIPYGLLGYSQGCANALMAETLMLSGSPRQQKMLSRETGGLVCRQLLFSAANGTVHGPALERKVQRLIMLGEEFFKYQQGYVSRQLASAVLRALMSALDSAHFHKAMGGAQSFLPDGSRAFWREAQHLSFVPTCTLRGVLEPHTTPESLMMISNLLTKQSGSPLHDSQVHVYDAVGHPIYFRNRNGNVLLRCDIGEGAIQRTHHWSPLSEEVEILRTQKDVEHSSFDCAKDRHVVPWVEVNARFGFIKRKATKVPN